MTCITRLLPMVTRSPCFGRGRLTLPYPSRKHQRRRAVQTGLSEHFSQQQNPGDRRSATGGRRHANQPVRVREILLYLAEKTGKLLSKGLRERAATLQWLFWQVAGFGPMLGQNHHFNHYAPQPVPYAIERYQLETKRLYGVLEAELQKHPYLGGDNYSIADIATYPWVVSHPRQRIDLADYPAVRNWFERISNRPATERAYKLAEQG